MFDSLFSPGLGDKSDHFDQRRKDLGPGGEERLRRGLQLVVRQHQHQRPPLRPSDGRPAAVLHVHLLGDDGPTDAASTGEQLPDQRDSCRADDNCPAGVETVAQSHSSQRKNSNPDDVRL